MIKIREKWKVVVEDIDYFIAFTKFGEGFEGSSKPKESFPKIIKTEAIVLNLNPSNSMGLNFNLTEFRKIYVDIGTGKRKSSVRENRTVEINGFGRQNTY